MYEFLKYGSIVICGKLGLWQTSQPEVITRTAAAGIPA
jgi:hypothetical protein